MNFFDRLKAETESERQHLLSAPLISAGLDGETTVATYAAFLQQAYHHVCHTTPLLMAVGARLPASKEWLRAAVASYIAEELGHQEWILDDIEACGYSRETARNSKPNFATELMVAYAYDTINRKNPVGFFGMVHVLEGTSIGIASAAADALQGALKLPDSAFTYLRSHGALDQDHVKFFESLMNQIDDPADQDSIIHCARAFYRLYGDTLRSVSPADVADSEIAA